MSSTLILKREIFYFVVQFKQNDNVPVVPEVENEWHWEKEDKHEDELTGEENNFCLGTVRVMIFI